MINRHTCFLCLVLLFYLFKATQAGDIVSKKDCSIQCARDILPNLEMGQCQHWEAGEKPSVTEDAYTSPSCGCTAGCMCYYGTCENFCKTGVANRDPYRHWMYNATGDPQLTEFWYDLPIEEALVDPASVAACMQGCIYMGICQPPFPLIANEMPVLGDTPSDPCTSITGVLEYTPDTRSIIEGCVNITADLLIHNQTFTTISLPLLTNISGTLSIRDDALLTAINLPLLQAIGKVLRVWDDPVLLHFDAPQLRVIGRDLDFSRIGAVNLTSLDVIEMASSVTIAYNPSLIFCASFPLLSSNSFGAFLITNNPLIVNLSIPMPNLTKTQDFSIESNTGLLRLVVAQSLVMASTVSVQHSPILTNITGFEKMTSTTLVNYGYLTLLQGIPEMALLTSYLSIYIESLTSLQDIAGFNRVGSGDLLLLSRSGMRTISGFRGMTSSVQLSLTQDNVLTDVSGFNTVSSVSAIDVVSNSALADISGFSQLITASTRINLQSNGALKKISGFPKLVSSNGLTISQSGTLNNITAFKNLKTVGGSIFLSGLSLTNLDFLASLQSTQVFQAILTNLADIRGLSHLTSVSSTFYIETASHVKSITPLCSLKNVGSPFEIWSDQLCVESAQAVAAGITGASLIVHGGVPCTQDNYFTCNCTGATPCNSDQICVDNSTSIARPPWTCIAENPCANVTCLQGGTCTSNASEFFCNCPNGYIGRFCEINPDDCIGNACQNGATCVDGLKSYTCTCPTGYDAWDCTHNINDCHDQCLHNGTCADGVDSFMCQCAEGYEGTLCEFNINDCHGQCLNNATCMDGVSNFTCQCLSGFTGSLCETNTNDCHDQCLNGGTCVDGVNSFTCQCSAGYTGNLCETNIDDCVGHVCLNGGTCVDGVNEYTCLCNEGYSGFSCEIYYDHCEDVVCLNGGNCVDELHSFHCDCAPGYEDALCQVNHNDCVPGACKNNAACVDGVNGFTCICPTGYEGATCQTNTDDCLSLPCANNSTCVDAVAGFSCNCTVGYTGALCNVTIAVAAEDSSSWATDDIWLVAMISGFFFAVVIIFSWRLYRECRDDRLSCCTKKHQAPPSSSGRKQQEKEDKVLVVKEDRPKRKKKRQEKKKDGKRYETLIEL